MLRVLRKGMSRKTKVRLIGMRIVVHFIGVFVRRAAIGGGHIMESVSIMKEDIAAGGKKI